MKHENRQGYLTSDWTATYINTGLNWNPQKQYMNLLSII